MTEGREGPGIVALGTSVFLRRPEKGDETEFLAMIAAGTDFYRPWINPPSSPDEFAAYLVRASRRTGDAFLVCLVASGAIVGAFNLAELSARGRTAFISYYVHPSYARQGLMREGLQLLLGHAFGPLGLVALGASIQPGNAASAGLVAQAGFRPEKAPPRYLRLFGVWRGHPTWSLTAARWRALAADTEAEQAGAPD